MFGFTNFENVFFYKQTHKKKIHEDLTVSSDFV